MTLKLLNCAAMKKMFVYKAATLVLIFATVGAVSVRAQDDEITSIDDFLEESAPENNATTDDANDMALERRVIEEEIR